MEKEGQCLAFLDTEGLELGTLVIDRHPSIQKFMREEVHYYDVWHVGKGMYTYMLHPIIECQL